MPGYLGNDPAGSATKIARQTYTTSGAATTDFTFTSGYDVGYLDVYVNGERQTKGKNFTASDGSTFKVLNGGVGTGSTVEAIAYKTFNLATVDFDDLGNTGNLTLTGDISGANATFTGDVSIGGTLTYEDVTNIDSVGVITARAGVDIITGGIDIVGNTTGLNVTGVGTFVDVNVSGAATVAGNLVIADKIVHSGDTNTAIRFPAADTFTVETAGSEVLRVDSTGDVGIGTEDPTQKLHLFNRTASGALIHYDGASNSHFGLRIRSNSDGGNFESDFANGTTAMLDLFADASTVSGGDFLVCRSQSNVPILLVKGNGNIGIGTDNPQSELEIQSATDPKIRLESQESGSKRLELFIDGGEAVGTIAADQSASQLAFRTAGSERLRITSTGRIGVGTVGPTHSLHVYDATDNSAQRNDVQAYTGGITIQNQSEVFDAFAALRFNFHGDDSFYLKTRRIGNNNGEFEIGQNYSSTSTDDIAIKIDNNLNVGIGTTIPGTELHVQGNNGYAELRLSGNSGSGGTIEFYEATTKVADIFADTTNNIVFRNTTEALRIDVGGNVNIAGITTATQLFEGSTRVATAGKAVAMALVFG